MISKLRVLLRTHANPRSKQWRSGRIATRAGTITVDAKDALGLRSILQFGTRPRDIPTIRKSQNEGFAVAALRLMNALIRAVSVRADISNVCSRGRL